MSATRGTFPVKPPRWREDGWQLQCRTCGDWWPLTVEFYDPKHGTARCRACWAEYQRQYQRGRRLDEGVVTGIRAARRAKYRANREAHLAATRRWKAANRERIAAYQREYRARRKAA